MNIAIIQTEIYWESIDQNLSRFESIIQKTGHGFDFIILPEMFSTGFTMNPSRFSEAELEQIPQWMQKMSNTYRITLAGSSIAKEGGGYYNRFFFSRPHTEMAYYNKRHLFRMGEEQKNYQAGSQRKIFQLGQWRICPQVCYDLRFPVWSRNTNDYDILVYVANWPAPRRDAWTALLKARAIENQSFVVGVNRVGDDPKTSYAGESVVFSPKGEVLSAPLNGHPEVISANISLEQLHAFRKKFPAWMDADTFSLDASDLLSMRVL